MPKILKPERTSSYAYHTEGTANLIRLRSPSSFTTPYEQMLFLAHIGPAFSEAFYRGEPCYLARPEWMKLYVSLARETPNLTERSPLIIRIRKAFLYSSGLFVDTSRALSVDGQNDPGFILTLELKIRAIHHDLLNCLEGYKAYMVRMTLTRPPKAASIVEQGALGTVLLCLCVYKRMLAALCEVDRLRLETECQALAVFIRQPHEQSSARHSWIHTDLEYGVTLVLQNTRSSWEEDLMGQSAVEQRLASRKRWKDFRGHTSQYSHTAGKNVSKPSKRLHATLSESPKQRWT
jgi:hypothetical protein